MEAKINKLKTELKGDFFDDQIYKTLYATDASVYRELPLGVAFPRCVEDIRCLINFALSEKTSLIPRTAGTSLAGQCVGNGIVVDVSQHFNNILEINAQEAWVRVQAGVVRDELNRALKPHGLFFGPNTSTANRAMIGGMVGNNSSGSHSIVYGTTRDQLLEVKALLADGSEAVFSALEPQTFEQKLQGNDLEGRLYKHICDELSPSEVQAEVKRHFPKSGIHRRNTGYAVDELLKCQPFASDGDFFNFCKLLAGSEGTLAFFTEIKLALHSLPPPETALLCPHFETVDEALRAVLIALEHQPQAVELMDKTIMDCTKNSREHSQNRFFLQGEPEAVLMIEIAKNTSDELEQAIFALIADFEANGYGYHYPVVRPPNAKRVWDLRKAGLGLLTNMPGDAKPVAVIEDTAVSVTELPQYIAEFTKMMEAYGQKAVYYAHAGAGELHLRPILNLKKPDDVKAFRDIGESTARLVKKYGGSLSGEHGDGRVRAEFIPLMVGEKNYALLQRIKKVWDPHNIFNPGKIVDAPPMNEQLRYETGRQTRQFDTVFDYSADGGILRSVEKCNGSADCRKPHTAGGTMCPSYMATLNEKDSTRARANILREMLTRSTNANPFAHSEIYEVMDLCLSCKGCTYECPSNVDMASLKAEFLHQYHKKHGVPARSRLFANFGRLNTLGAQVPGLANFALNNRLTNKLFKRKFGIAQERDMPKIAPMRFRKWFGKNKKGKDAFAEISARKRKGKLYLYCDEFTDFTDVEVGKKTVLLLTHLGYEVSLPQHPESGRAHLSKGLLLEAQQLATQNVTAFKDKVTAETPLVGIEPSCILGFRDEFPRLVPEHLRKPARQIGENTLMLEEFLCREMDKGNIGSDAFALQNRKVLLHGHCHQKALSSVSYSERVLSLPPNYEVEVIPSGCCGMAGSFGYEAEHYDLSMKIGELVLFPAVRHAAADVLIARAGDKLSPPNL